MAIYVLNIREFLQDLAMAKTTGVTTAIAAEMLLSGKITFFVSLVSLS